MKKVITMVGASIFENYLKEKRDENTSAHLEYLKNKRSGDLEKEKERYKRLQKNINSWVEGKVNRTPEDISAEIKSLLKLKEYLKDEFEIYLLCSDTILSILAGEIVNESLKKLKKFEKDEVYVKVIEKLQIWDLKDFRMGMSNLISKIYNITGGNWGNVVINITGGYKATIPYLTILAQINQCPIYYIFEDTESLIEVPNIPLTMEWFNCDELLNYSEKLEELRKGIDEKEKYEKLINSEFFKKYSLLVWTDDEGLAESNPIGEIIYNKCNEKYLTVFIHEDEWKKIDKNEKLKNIISNRFSNQQLRKENTEIKRNHYVFDSGDNPFRIFYREKDGQVWIYKVFDNHDEYERYLKSQEYKEDLIEKSKEKFILWKIKKEEKHV